MITHTITPLPNGDFLWKIIAEGKTVQTTEIPQESAYEMADAINASGRSGYITFVPTEPQDA